MALRRAYGQPYPGRQGFSRTMKCFGAKVNILPGDVNVAANQVALFRVPAEFVVISTMIITDKLDASGGPSSLLTAIGDAENNQRLMAASAISRTGGTSISLLPTTSYLYYYPSETEILMTCLIEAYAPAAGSLKFYIQGFMC